MNTSATGGFLTPTDTTGPAAGDDLDDILQALFVGLSGLDGTLVRPRWQTVTPKQPAIDVNWCAVGVTELTSDAYPATTGGAFVRHQGIQVLASFYGPFGMVYAMQAQDGIVLPQNLEFLQSYLMTYSNTDTIRQVPELVNQQWVKRYDVPMRFKRQVKRTYAVQNFSSASDVIIPG